MDPTFCGQCADKLTDRKLKNFTKFLDIHDPNWKYTKMSVHRNMKSILKYSVYFYTIPKPCF